MQCKICGQKNFKILRKKVRYDIRRDVLQCGNCGFVFLRPLDEKNRKFYEDKIYRRKYGPNLGKVSSSREVFNTYLPHQQEIISAMGNILKYGMSVLDVGCSTGHFLHALKGRVKKRVGIELSRDAANFIKNNLDFKVYSEPIEKLKMKEAPFDLITCFQVLEHIDDPLSFLKELGKNLKPNGILYLELPNVDEILIKYYKVPGFADFYYREPHVSYFSPKTLKMLLEKAGFEGEVKTIQRYNFLNQISWLQTGKPQSTFSASSGTPKLITDRSVNVGIRNDLNTFIAEADKNYRKILEKHSLGDQLAFAGRKVKKNK